ncbi:uncharacterized protein ARMOST_16052 [Armillaria ostoyae]|uniref:Uncharacterized protein n=1 Tax=Armillaria ostoyae TaxID=47428 RepID=A0A284RV41_ARMOS|nr:uncharacterized protein ARMOST_16052 [Armillaria ostoyae]
MEGRDLTETSGAFGLDITPPPMFSNNDAIIYLYLDHFLPECYRTPFVLMAQRTFQEWTSLIYNDDSDPGRQSESDSELEDLPPFPNVSEDQAEGGDQSAKAKETAITEQVLSVLSFMKTVGVTLPDFLDALSWGNDTCITNSRIQYHRTQLMTSQQLLGILRRWWRPPRSSTAQSRKQGPEGGRHALQAFMRETWPSVISQEIESLTDDFLSPPQNDEDVSEHVLTSLDFPSMIEKIKTQTAPNLWATLRTLTSSPQQDSRRRNKNPDTVCSSD